MKNVRMCCRCDSVLLDMTSTSDAEDKEINVMHLYQIIRIFSNACDQKNVKQIKNLHANDSFILKNIPDLGTATKEILSKPETRGEFKGRVIDKILSDFCDKCQDNNDELLFFASAKFEFDRLRGVIEELASEPTSFSERINQTRYSDSAIIFALKYGNISNLNFSKCLKTLIASGLDVNKFDIKGRAAIDYIAMLHERNKGPPLSDILKEIALSLLDQNIFKPDTPMTLDFLANDMKIDVTRYAFATMDEETLLFYWITTNKSKEILAFENIERFVNIDNGENTLLQLASKQTDKMVKVVQHLLAKGADPNKATKRNPLTPLELAGKNDKEKIFAAILNDDATRIRPEQYNNFIKWRSQSMKPKLFEQLLESDKLDPNFTYERTGNTPLHYAIFFCHKGAIRNLLNRHSSLVGRNEFGVSPLDIIDAGDLEKHFDSYLVLDHYTPHFSHVNYKMRLRFNCLADHQSKEMNLVSEIGKHAHIEHLLMHPLVHTYIALKWFQMKIYFWLILVAQAIIFSLLSLLIYRLPSATLVEYIFCIFLSFVNLVLKTPVFLYFKCKSKRPVFLALDRATLHGSLEILIIITIVGCFLHNVCRAFVFVEMAISLLLTAGYHPRLSKWSLMLQRVFKTFTVLLIFFSLIVVAFSVGFHILFPDDTLFKKFFSAIFRTFIMTTGEFNIGDDTGLDKSGFGGYLIFILFAMSMSLVIVNFWTGVAVTDIERIEKDSEINGFKNVIVLLLFIDYIYSRTYLSKLRNHIPNPLLFLRIHESGSISQSPEKYEIDFFPNKRKHFERKVPSSGNQENGAASSTTELERGFPAKLDDDCFNKLRGHYYKLAKISEENEILTRVRELSRMVTELKAKH